MRPPGSARLTPYLISLAALGLITTLMVVLRPYLGLATVALVYLLLVFLSAVWSGRGASIMVSVLAFLAMNFFFTVPYNTFVVATLQDVLSLLAFLLIAEMTNGLVAKLRDREADARRQGTERLRLQQEAAEAEILRKTDELKSNLLSAVSHDLRTPLSSIRMAATALMQNGVHWTDDARHELLEMIDAEAARLSRLVGNLLDLSRIEAGALQPLKEWCNLQEVAARAVDSLHDRLREHRVVVDIPEELPLVPLDFAEIEDVFVNLLDNSIRHAPEGTEIRITAGAQDRRVVVQVENAGPPISPEVAGQIFDRFYTTHGRRRGTGLGLAICKGLIEAHGGRIWVERPGEAGARFAFALPLAEAPAVIETSRLPTHV